MPDGRLNRMRGRGNFTSLFDGILRDGDLNKAASWMGKAIGKFAENGLGMAAGSLRRAIGQGDYEIRKNSLIDELAGTTNNDLKRFSFAESGASRIRVKKREYLGPITAPAANPENFSLLQYRIQPTNTSTFPWLSHIAELYSEYELRGAIFSFETTSSNYSATVGLGTVGMATQYNANMLSYSDMDSMLQASYHSRGNPSEDILHGIECDPALQASEKLFTRRPGANGPPNLYDHGVFYIATEGLPAGSAGVTLGRLFVTYDVELAIPELPVMRPWYTHTAMTARMSGTHTEPPMGPTLSITQSVDSSMTFGAAAGSNVLLLAPSSGPHVRPALNPDDENSLFAWMSDNSGNTTQQFISFSEAGSYMIIMERADTGPFADYVEAGFTLTNSNNCVISEPTWQYLNIGGPPVNATDKSATWSWRIEAQQADATVVLDRNDGRADDAGVLRMLKV